MFTVVDIKTNKYGQEYINIQIGEAINNIQNQIEYTMLLSTEQDYSFVFGSDCKYCENSNKFNDKIIINSTKI